MSQPAVTLLRGAEHHLCLDFRLDGVDFTPNTNSPADLADRLAQFVQAFVRNEDLPIANVDRSSTRLRPGAQHHVCLDFMPDGTMNFFAATRDHRALMQRFFFAIRSMAEHPSAIHCIAGDHVAHRGRR